MPTWARYHGRIVLRPIENVMINISCFFKYKVKVFLFEMKMPERHALPRHRETLTLYSPEHGW